MYSKFTVSISLLLLLSACRKTYTCSCGTTIQVSNANGNHNTYFYPGSLTPYSKKLTKKQAESACYTAETTIRTNMTNWYTFNGRYPLSKGEAITTECTIVE